MFKKKGTILMAIGLLFLTAALAFVVYNVYTEKQAEKFSNEVAKQLAAEMTAVEKAADYKIHPDKEMPVVCIDGEYFVGMLEIPYLGVKLPVYAGPWNYEKLRSAPCLYEGSVYKDNMIIAAHNYSSFFGGIGDLPQGSEVRFTDADGNTFLYETAWVEVLQPTDTEKMTASEGWDLTLFTCTFSLTERLTLRCYKKNLEL
ncbi:MAG: sortase [Firmicutes bacterium]|nr:sortase [Bacillota bacterium]